MHLFLCHSSKNADFVCQVAHYLRRCGAQVFYYELHQRADASFASTIDKELAAADSLVVFADCKSEPLLSQWQIDEINAVRLAVNGGKTMQICTVVLNGAVEDVRETLLAHASILPQRFCHEAGEASTEAAVIAARTIAQKMDITWQTTDDLPWNPHLFDYEKDIIDFFALKPMVDTYFESLWNDDCTEKHLRDHLISRLVATCPAWIGEDLRAKIKPLRRLVAAEKEIEPEVADSLIREVREVVAGKLLDGCPPSWPEVLDWEILDGSRMRPNPLLEGEAIGSPRPKNNRVLAAALSQYHCEAGNPGSCMIAQRLLLPEAGPREKLYFPRNNQPHLNVAILVSGGIAPGINAVIDGIVQRHRKYAKEQGSLDALRIDGIKNGLAAFERDEDWKNSAVGLHPTDPHCVDTSAFAHQGGSILGTARVEELIGLETRPAELDRIVNNLATTDILYVIGGDGSMKAAHALWSTAKAKLDGGNRHRPLSVVAIPKTMDNDILWVWQSFGFMSAVEKAREVMEHLYTEVESNPRLCVLQLFGSDSGFVVSHAVLASGTDHCDAALIPESDFCMTKLAEHVKSRMVDRRSRENERIPYGLVVMAESAIPTDAEDYLDETDENGHQILNDSERETVKKYVENLRAGIRPEGQTNDVLRSAGLKMVSHVLWKLIKDPSVPPTQDERALQPTWERFRVMTNEPRHLLRAIPPSGQDIINGQRLGTLAVDNAMAGYTDFMISQWLTEYVLVPLKLVTLGRKRIPRNGIFWKSVVAKTGQGDLGP